MMTFFEGRVMLLSTCPLTPKVKFNNQVMRRFSLMSDPLNSGIYLKFKQTQFVLMSFQCGWPCFFAKDTSKDATTSAQLLWEKEQAQGPTSTEVKASSWLVGELLGDAFCINKWTLLN